MLLNWFVVRNHIHRDKISNIFDISNFKKSFLGINNWKQIIDKDIHIESISKKKGLGVNK